MKILIVEDDPQVRNSTAQILERAGYDICQAEDGEIGLSTFREEKPDIVILDIIMPNKEGIEIIPELRTIRPSSKILAISGGGRSNAQDYLTLADVIGADATLAKPFERVELLAIVTKLARAIQKAH